MENKDTNTLIEQYLDGTLPPNERLAVETRMETDAAFRAEVHLHRQLHTEFADRKKLQLRDVMGDIIRETPTPRAVRRWPAILGIVLAILIGAWLFRRWFSAPGEPLPPATGKKTVPERVEPAVPPKTPDGSAEPSKKVPERPIARIDPAAFTPNRTFEDRLNGNIRASGSPVEMKKPTPGADFTPENGFVKIYFQGTVPAAADTARYPLILNIYTNQVPVGQPLVRVQPAIENRTSATGTWMFSATQRLRLRPGLYYFTLERKADEDLLYVGKFTVGAR